MITCKMLNFRSLLIAFCILVCSVQIARNASLSLQELKKYQSFIEGQGLFSADDDVIVLTHNNFKNEVYHKDHAWVIEFYNSWCGFCQRFAPSWKALATDIKAWSDMIKIGAIDCSDEDNNPICRDFEIMAYPSLRYFHENYEEDPKNLGSSVEKGEDMQGHKQYIIDTIISEQDTGRARIFPGLHPVTDASISDIRSSVGADKKYIFLVVQNATSYVGPEVILDFHRADQIAIKYTLNSNSKLLSSAGVTANDLAALVVISANDGSVEILGKNLKTKLEFEEAIRTFLKPKSNIELPDTKPKKTIFTGKWIDAEVPDMSAIIQERERYALMQKVKQMGDVVFQMDLETALRYSLKHEVTSTSEISGERLDALKAYLTVLAKYFPLGDKGQVLLADIRDLVGSDGSSFRTSQIRTLVLEAEKEESQVFSSPPNWLGCKGSAPGLRGYPCGVWKMFHYLTVKAADWNPQNRTGDPHEVLDAMHGYIKHFFGCADCSQHFQEMAQRRNIRNVSSHDSAILWLWMAHNEVNKRLAGDPTEDPDYPKYQFPLKERCPVCRHSNETWNYLEVLKYVKHMYSNINVRYIGSDTRIIHMGLEGPTTTSGGTSIFKAIDATEVPEKDLHVQHTGEGLIVDEVD